MAAPYKVTLDDKELIPYSYGATIFFKKKLGRSNVTNLFFTNIVFDIGELMICCDLECVHPNEDKTGKNLQKKFSIQNIKPKSSYGKSYEYLATDETGETKDLSLQQLERLVLLDQLKFYRMQMEEMKGKKEEVKKEEKSTVNLLQERDCIAV